MKRFVVAAAFAIALSLGYSNTADAQIVYGYTVPNAGGIASGGTILVPGGYKAFNSYYSPFTGTMTNQVYSQNFMGQAYGRTYGYSPLTGTSYQSGFYQPNYWVNPYGGYNYSMVRRWGW
jgi:hypothetical protein